MAAELDDPIAEFDSFVQERVRSGRYASVGEVLALAKATLLEHEADHDLDIEYVRKAVEEGVASGVYEGDAFADLRTKFGLPARA